MRGLGGVITTEPALRYAIPRTSPYGRRPSILDTSSTIVSSPSPMTSMSKKGNSLRVCSGRSVPCTPPRIIFASGLNAAALPAISCTSFICGVMPVKPTRSTGMFLNISSQRSRTLHCWRSIRVQLCPALSRAANMHARLCGGSTSVPPVKGCISVMFIELPRLIPPRPLWSKVFMLECV